MGGLCRGCAKILKLSCQIDRMDREREREIYIYIYYMHIKIYSLRDDGSLIMAKKINALSWKNGLESGPRIRTLHVLYSESPMPQGRSGKFAASTKDGRNSYSNDHVGLCSAA